MDEENNYEIFVPYKNKKIFIIKYQDNHISFYKLLKYSLTKENNEMLTDEYNKYQIISKNNLSLKYNFENFNQIITMNNVVFDSNISLNILNNDIPYTIDFNTKILNIDSNDIDYYNEDNISEDEDEINKIKKSKKIKYKFKTINFTIKKICFIVCDYDYRKSTFDKFIYKKNIEMAHEIIYIKNVLNNLESLYEEQHFIHGDLKCDNILLLKDENYKNNNIKNIKPYFFDLEFSILCTQNKVKIISGYNPRINLYLNLQPNFYLLKEFFHMFDYYLFTISILSYHSELKKNISFVSFLDTYLNSDNDKNIMLFFYFYDKLCFYFRKNNIELNVNTMLDYCEYETIYKILNYSYNKSLSSIEDKIKKIYYEIDNINK
jgi:hypothetical protein